MPKSPCGEDNTNAVSRIRTVLPSTGVFSRHKFVLPPSGSSGPQYGLFGAIIISKLLIIILKQGRSVQKQLMGR